MKSYEFITEAKSITVYHGTAEKFLTSIMKSGLSPRISRLKVVYPRNYDMTNAVGLATKAKSKTELIKQINKLMNDPKWKVASGSNKSDLIHIKSKSDNIRVHSSNLKELPAYLASNPTVEDWYKDDDNRWIETTAQINVDSAIIKKIQQIISQNIAMNGIGSTMSSP